jgi:hypothetical protein
MQANLEKGRRTVKLIKRPEMDDGQRPDVFLCKVNRTDFMTSDTMGRLR